MNNYDRFLSGEIFTMDGIAYKLAVVLGTRFIYVENYERTFQYVAMISKIDEQGIHWNTNIMDTSLQGFTPFCNLTFSPKAGAEGGEEL
jgi:hypothetical protein